MKHDNNYSIVEIRAFSGYNLLEGAAVIEAPDPKDLSFGANNLLENFELSSSRQDLNAITDWNGLTGGDSIVTRAS